MFLINEFGNIYRCDNLNDCRDKSDEANCKRVIPFFLFQKIQVSYLQLFSQLDFLVYDHNQVKMVPTYQKFIVPPPLMTDNMTKVRKRSLFNFIFSFYQRIGSFSYQFLCICYGLFHHQNLLVSIRVF